MKRSILLLVGFLILFLPAMAADISLAWDASVSPGVAGYKVYVGVSSRVYGTPITLGNQTTYTVTHLGSAIWYFAVTAFDVDGNESDYSNEVSEVIGSPVDVTAPAISNVASSNVTQTEATIAWDLDEFATGQVEYGATASYGSASIQETSLNFKAHSQTLINLAPNTQYHYRVKSSDDAGNLAISSDFTFTTLNVAFEIKTLAVSMRWFGVVLLCTTSQNAQAILRYTDLETGEKQTVIATPTPFKTEHRAVLYLNMGKQKYYRYEWTVTNKDGLISTLGGTFQVR